MKNNLNKNRLIKISLTYATLMTSMCSSGVMANIGEISAVDNSIDVIMAVAMYIFSEWGVLYALAFIAVVSFVSVVYPVYLKAFVDIVRRFMTHVREKSIDAFKNILFRNKD